MVDKNYLEITLKNGLDDTNHRINTRTSFKSKEETFDLYKAHFSWTEEQSAMNVKEAVQFMEKGNSSTILAGDLNTTADSISFLLFQNEKFTDAWHISYKKNWLCF